MVSFHGFPHHPNPPTHPPTHPATHTHTHTHTHTEEKQLKKRNRKQTIKKAIIWSNFKLLHCCNFKQKIKNIMLLSYMKLNNLIPDPFLALLFIHWFLMKRENSVCGLISGSISGRILLKYILHAIPIWCKKPDKFHTLIFHRTKTSTKSFI